MIEDVVRLDVREDLKAGREPFNKIMAAVQALREGQRFLLIAPFEPRPLYTVLGRMGFDHSTRQTPDGAWEVLFFRRG